MVQGLGIDYHVGTKQKDWLNLNVALTCSQLNQKWWQPIKSHAVPEQPGEVDNLRPALLGVRMQSELQALTTVVRLGGKQPVL